MNERIFDLAEQAGLQLGIVLENSTTPVKTITVEQRKFAELIVKECAGIVTDAVDHREPASTYADRIQQHFGVEE